MIRVDHTPLRRLMMIGAAAGAVSAVKETETGNPLTFLTDLARPLKSLLIPFTPKQTGSGDPSPSNVRPIVPWDGVTVFGGGKNLLNPAYFAESSEFYSVDNGIITAKKSDYRSWGSLPKMFLRAGTYTISKSTADGVMVVRSSINDYSSSVVYAEGVASGKFTLSVDAYIAIKPSENMSYPATFTLQLEAGQTVTAYEPYVPITETDVSFASPVYGGTLDVVSGVLTVTHVLLTKNTSDMNNGEDYPGWKNSGIEDIIGTGVNELLRNILTNVSPVSNLSVGANTAYSGDVLYLNKSFFNKTQSEWNALAIDIQILVPLATPQEIQLTPQQITALAGDNTIWSDANGQMTAVYLKKR